MKAPFELLTPWAPIDSADSAKFEDEYAVEIGKAHPLYEGIGEQDAGPNGDPATPVGNSGITEEPPSVS